MIQVCVLVLTVVNTCMGAYAIHQRNHTIRLAKKRHKKGKKK